MSFKKFGTLLIFGALLAAPYAYAQEAALVSGGIGEGGIARMESVQSQYSLKAVFSGNGGIFLSDVDATILDRAGNEVASTTTDGPILLAALAPGRYTLVATYGNVNRRVNFRVGRGLRIVNVRLPVNDNDSVATHRDMGRYADGRAVKGPEPYYDPDFQARGYYPNATTTTVVRSYPNSYYETHTDWDAQPRGYDNGAIDTSGWRDEYAPPGMAVEGTHATRGHDTQEP